VFGLWEENPLIRLGIIGAGAAVENLHLPVLTEMKERVCIVAVASRTQEKAEAMAARMGAQSFADYRQLLESDLVDAVLTAVPIHMNARVLSDCLAAGKNVLAEKPLAANASESRELLKMSVGRSVIVAVGENWRYREDIRKARAIVEDGLIGEVYAFQINVRFNFDSAARRVWTSRSWRASPSHAGGFLLDHGVHPVAALREILGDVRRVSSLVLDRHPVIHGPDSLLMQMELASGAVGQYLATYTAIDANESLFDMTVFGSEGTLRVNNAVVSWNRGANEPGKTLQFDSSDGGYRAQWRNFVNAVHGVELVYSTLEKAHKDLLVIDTALNASGVQDVPAI
jgi:predicted dehydrogenase